jgi:hypothetical protein
MDFKTKALFLFGILLFGIVLSYFLGGTMEGFDSTATAITPDTSAADNTTKIDDTNTYDAKTYDNYNHYNDMTSTKYYGSTGTPINPLREDDEEVSSTDPVPSSSVNNSSTKDYGTQYYSTLPPGIPASQILPGDEHLYILKSEIVPPVCPACPAFPSASVVNNKDPPPPCPPCGRCPEPSFECKKVPNYNAINNDEMPLPVLNDFSSFGM